MNVSDAVLARRSVRAFAERPVPQEILTRILDRARWAPSWGNTQPWKLTLVAGRVLQRIKEEYVRLSREEVPPRPDVSMPTEFNPVQKGRYRELGIGLFGALGIGRGDQEKRRTYYEAMMRAFGAPHLLYLHMERGFHPYALMDAGIFLQTVALLAVGEGLGSCFLAQSVRYPDVVRKHAAIPQDQMLVMGLAMGYPMEDHPANRFRSGREPLEGILRRVGAQGE